MEASQSKEVVRRLHRELLTSRDLATVDRFFAASFVSHNMPPGFPPGVAGVKQFFTMLRDAAPDVEVTIDELVGEDDKVAVATTISGTHERALFGVPASGRRMSVTGIDLVRLEEGLIVEHRGLTDTVGLIRQLGGAPPTG